MEWFLLNWKNPMVKLATKPTQSDKCKSLAKTRVFRRCQWAVTLHNCQLSNRPLRLRSSSGKNVGEQKLQTCPALKCTNLAMSIAVPIGVVKKKSGTREFFYNLAVGANRVARPPPGFLDSGESYVAGQG
jgi:hypothetical protein